MQGGIFGYDSSLTFAEKKVSRLMQLPSPKLTSLTLNPGVTSLFDVRWYLLQSSGLMYLKHFHSEARGLLLSWKTQVLDCILNFLWDQVVLHQAAGAFVMLFISISETDSIYLDHF